MIDLHQIKNGIFQEFHEDDVGLWSILWDVRYALNGGTYPGPGEDRSDPREVRRLTMSLVRELLESGKVWAGFPTPDGRGFVPWKLTPDEAVARINAAWDALGREPNIGDIVWFAAADEKRLSGAGAGA
jgi:hypothetical protein